MLAACSHLLRRCGGVILPNQFAGLALQSAGRSLQGEAILADNVDVGAADMRVAEGAAASTSSSFVAFHQPTSQLHASPPLSTALGLLTHRRFASTLTADEALRQRELLREAMQRVPSDSPWLIAYNRNVNARQVTFRLGKRRTLKALLEGWALYQERFDTITMAAFLRRVRVMQLYDSEFQPEEVQRVLEAFQTRLRNIGMRYGTLRDVTAYLHALAKLSSPPPMDSTNGDKFLATDGSSPSADGLLLVQPIFNQPADLLLDLAAWATRNRTELLQASPQRLATLLWALTRLLPAESYSDERLQVVLDRVALSTLRRLQNLAPLDLRIFALAYATFGPRHTPDAVPAADAASVNLNAGPSSWPAMALARPGAGKAEQQAAQAASSGSGGEEDRVARRLIRNARVLKSLARELVSRAGNLAVPQPEPRDLAIATHAAALQLPKQPMLHLIAKAAGAACTAPTSLTAVELVALVEACAVQRVRHLVLLEAVRKVSARWQMGASAEGAVREGVVGTEASDEGARLRARLEVAYKELGVEL